MSQIQQWAGALCILILIAAVIQYLVPSGVMERSMRLVLGGFVVLSLIIPFADLVRNTEWNFEIQEDVAVTEEYAEHANERILELAQSNIETLIAETLQKMNLSAKKITVTMDSNEDNCIVIKKAVITLALADAERMAAVEEKLWSVLGIKAEVVIDGR